MGKKAQTNPEDAVFGVFSRVLSGEAKMLLQRVEQEGWASPGLATFESGPASLYNREVAVTTIPVERRQNHDLPFHFTPISGDFAPEVGEMGFPGIVTSHNGGFRGCASHLPTARHLTRMVRTLPQEWDANAAATHRPPRTKKASPQKGYPKARESSTGATAPG